jgi:hypothetical protein
MRIQDLYVGAVPIPRFIKNNPIHRFSGVCVFISAGCVCVCFITAGPITKLFAWGGEESGGHVL